MTEMDVTGTSRRTRWQLGSELRTLTPDKSAGIIRHYDARGVRAGLARGTRSDGSEVRLRSDA